MNAAELESRVEFVPEAGCWLWTGANYRGYGRFHHEGRLVAAHRFSYELYRGAIPDGMFVWHKCDTPACVNPDHLFVGTHHDNVLDMHRKRRAWTPVLTGAANGRARLTEAQVVEIAKAKGSQKQIAARYNIAATTVANIQHGRRWKHLTQPREGVQGGTDV